MMRYKGYVGRIEFDDEADLFHGEVLGIRDVITFQGKSVDEIRQALKDSVEDYLQMCKKHGRKPEKPFSGNLLLRLDSDLHRRVTCAASREGKSLNKWIVEALKEKAA